MNETINIFDIETAPDLDVVKKFTKAFKPEDVKLGNLKDPEKIAIKMAGAEEAYWAKAFDKAALDPYTSQICAIGIHLEGDSEAIILEGGEKEILTAWWSIFNERTHELWAYYTGSNDKTTFDPRHIINRSWVLGVPVPKGIISHTGFLSGCFVDMAQTFLAGATYPTYCSADMCAKKLGLVGGDDLYCTDFSEIQSKEFIEGLYGVAGKNVHKFFRGDAKAQEVARVYLINDLALERGIADRIL